MYNTDLYKDSKWIPGFINKYKVTKEGEIISYFREPHPIKTSIQKKSGYHTITLYTKKSNDTTKYKYNYTTILVHKLVMDMYGQPKPNDGNHWVVQHIDKNRDNNSLNNLQWVKRTSIKTKRPCPVKSISIDKDDHTILFRSLTACSNYFHTNQVTIRKHINKGTAFRGYKHYNLK